MAQDQRTFQIGRLTELRALRETLRIEIDAMVKSLIVHFEPLDADLTYVDKINPERVNTYSASIERKKKQLDKLNRDIQQLEIATGMSGT